MEVLLLDNYDSFTYNLAQMCEQLLGYEITVAKNDVISLEEVKFFDKIILSPGPGIPDEAGILKEVIKTFYKYKPILGVCLGLQAIIEVFGGKIYRLAEVCHGIASCAKKVREDKLLQGLPTEIMVGRYHSWAADAASLPAELEITSVTDDGVIMSLKHKNYPLHAVQYHPESILTPLGREVLRNFLFEI